MVQPMVGEGCWSSWVASGGRKNGQKVAQSPNRVKHSGPVLQWLWCLAVVVEVLGVLKGVDGGGG